MFLGVSIFFDVLWINKLSNYPFDLEGQTYCIDLDDENNFHLLNGKHTIFGRVCRGMEIIKRLGSVQTDNNDRPIHDVKILWTSVKD
ncbi:hypothetical protein CRYUN_Cryun09bG0051000 [Craigia yunnanensis]